MAFLEQPLHIRGVTLPTRIVMPPMATHRAGVDGRANAEMASHYGERARARGFGLIETEHHYVSADGRADLEQPSAARDDDIEALALAADAVHAAGTPILLQVNHAGSAACSSVVATTPIAPSCIQSPRARSSEDTPRAMTTEDIERVKADYAAAARRAVAAGYDGVEVHAAHGYLLNQFYSPLTNQRSDAYGNDATGRARLIAEVIAAVRGELGSDRLISLRLGACDYTEGGAGLEDAVIAAHMAEEAGADLISISGGMCGYLRPGLREAGWFADASRAVRSAANVPVMLTGGIRTAEQAEGLLANGACDLVGVGRPTLRDPAWARKALEKLHELGY